MGVNLDQSVKYNIVDFFEESDEIRVEFGFNQFLDIKIPIDPLTNTYLVGEDLDKYIMSFKPLPTPLPYKKVSTVLNKDDIYKLVTKKKKNDINAIISLVMYNREVILRETDWTQLPDANKNLTDEDKNLWLEYRQKLRDITQQPGWPENIDWPKRPHILGVTLYE
jgi:hypothetical protein